MSVKQFQIKSIQPLSELEWSQYQKIGSIVLLIGMFTTFFGLGWDIEWHSDVGPDTFWTLPHIFVYSGAALAGMTCLTVVLLSSFVDRPRPSMIPVFKVFRAPVGFIVAGFGALGFLLFGLFDQWWHTLFGFDVAISSAPHVGLLLSNILTCAGGVLIFAQGKRVQPIMLALMLAVTVNITLPVALQNFNELDWTPLMMVFPALLLPFALMFAASVTRQISTILYAAGFIWLFRLICEQAFPIMTNAYIQVLGLSIRDNNENLVAMSFLTPALIPVSALAMFLTLKLGQIRNWKVAPTIYLASSLSVPFLFVDPLLSRFALGAPWAIPILALVGLGTGWLGWKLGVVARHANQELKAAETLDAR
ncbi:MAG: hypothetical protein RLZZ156_376 [Deinococcota bacterium]|jgi:hypothetical protein